ncbi:hypothetical protein LUR56_02495 [Streptomyces sp. MT29]|nr:hypothetical protein [Streptomyces sp. MT29]
MTTRVGSGAISWVGSGPPGGTTWVGSGLSAATACAASGGPSAVTTGVASGGPSAPATRVGSGPAAFAPAPAPVNAVPDPGPDSAAYVLSCFPSQKTHLLVLGVVQPHRLPVHDHPHPHPPRPLLEALPVAAALGQILGGAPVLVEGLLRAGQQGARVRRAGERLTGGRGSAWYGDEEPPVYPGRPAVGADHVRPVPAPLRQLRRQQGVERVGGPGDIGRFPGGQPSGGMTWVGRNSGAGVAMGPPYFRMTAGSWRRSSFATT